MRRAGLRFADDAKIWLPLFEIISQHWKCEVVEIIRLDRKRRMGRTGTAEVLEVGLLLTKTGGRPES